MARKQPANPWGEPPNAIRSPEATFGDPPGSTPFGRKPPQAASPSIGRDTPTLFGAAPTLTTSSGAASRTGTAQAPIKILAATYLGATLALALAFLGKSLPLFMVGWVLSAIVALGFALYYASVDRRLQVNPFYLYRTAPRVLYGVGVGLSILAIAACAAQIALYIGRL